MELLLQAQKRGCIGQSRPSGFEAQVCAVLQSDPYFVQMSEQVSRVLIDPIGAGPF